jgi:hypothetical protein
MPEPTERRRRAKATENPDSERPAASPAARSSEPTDRGRGSGLRGNVIWALVTGLAVGFAAGREAYRLGLGDGKAADPTVSASTAFIAAENAVKVYARMAEFPAGWVKDTDLPNGATLLSGLNDTQKTTVMQALNERNCECGCPFGKLATCLQKDPNCPRSPAMAKLAIDLAKQGKGLTEILAAIDAKQAEMGGAGKPAAQAQAAPEPPSGPRPVALAAWNPRKGPKAAKVTVVEFSDFQ